MADDGAAPFSSEPLVGVVFDLDGTLVLSHHDFPRMRRETIRLAERHGVLPGRLSVGDTIPVLLDKARSELTAQGVPEGEIFRLEAEVRAAHDAIELEALPSTTVRAGAPELLDGLRARGYTLGLLTRSSEGFCRGALAKTGLAEYFPFLRTRSAPGPAKPSPEALTILLDAMEVPHARALYVGDHAMDAECAARAGVRFIGILDEPAGPDDAERLRRAGARTVVPDLGALGRELGLVDGAVAR